MRLSGPARQDARARADRARQALGRVHRFAGIVLAERGSASKQRVPTVHAVGVLDVACVVRSMGLDTDREVVASRQQRRRRIRARGRRFCRSGCSELGKRCRSRQARIASCHTAGQLTPGQCATTPLAALRSSRVFRSDRCFPSGAVVGVCWNRASAGSSLRGEAITRTGDGGRSHAVDSDRAIATAEAAGTGGCSWTVEHGRRLQTDVERDLQQALGRQPL